MRNLIIALPIICFLGSCIKRDPKPPPPHGQRDFIFYSVDTRLETHTVHIYLNGAFIGVLNYCWEKPTCNSYEDVVRAKLDLDSVYTIMYEDRSEPSLSKTFKLKPANYIYGPYTCTLFSLD
jgi:hypothetical protein